MKRKFYTIILATVVLMTSLPACGGNNPNADERTGRDTTAPVIGTAASADEDTSDNAETATPDTQKPSLDTDENRESETLPPEDTEHPLMGKIVINEICSSNKTCLDDGKGNFYDWLEILNASDETIDLSGIGLSKKENEPYTLKMPRITLAPGAFLVIFCNKNEEAGLRSSNVYAPFNIGADGETIYLTAAADGNEKGELLDVVTVPKMKSDDVYGRNEDGIGKFIILSPTPNKSNGSAKEIKYISAPTFSSESGFYSSAFNLKLTANGGTVLYTTDCSDPLTSDSAQVYRSAIKIEDATPSPNVAGAESDFTLGKYSAPDYNVDKCTVIRAVAVDGDGFASEVITKTYFVGKTAELYSDFPVVTVSADHRDLFSGARGIYVVGDYYREWVNSSDYVEYSSADKRNPTNYNQDGREWEREATFQMFEDGKPVYNADCGLRIAGNWSRANSQKSFRLYARGEYGETKFNYPFFDGLTGYDGKIIDSFDKLTLSSGGNDWQNTKLVNTVVSDIVADRNISVSAYKPCVLFLNGEFWGMYFLCEKQEDEYIETHYGVKAENVTVVKNGSTEGDSSLVSEYKKTVLWALGTDMTDPEALAKVSETIDLNSLIDYIVTETYIINNDWSKETSLNNWMMWRSNTVDPSNPYCDGRWRFALFDVDMGLKQDVTMNPLTTMNNQQKWQSFTALFYKLCENSEFKNTFYERATEIIEENFAPDRANEIVSSYATLCQPMVELTYKRFGLKTSFTSKLSVIRNFLNNRPQHAMAYLKEFCGIP